MSTTPDHIITATALLIEQTEAPGLTLFVSAEGMTITLPKPQRTAIIQHFDGVFAEARKFALECVDILVTQHGARRAGIDISTFYYKAVGQQSGALLDGSPIRTPQQAVDHTIDALWPWVVGLAPATKERQAKIDAAWIEVTGGPADE